MLGDKFSFFLNQSVFLAKEALNGAGKAFMANPVCRIGNHRNVTALNFVNALCPSFNAVKTGADSKINRLIIACLKM